MSAGLASLRDVIRDRHIGSIAIPPLGCGNGGLDWSDVRPLIMEALGDLPGVRIMVYPPAGHAFRGIDTGPHPATAHDGRAGSTAGHAGKLCWHSNDDRKGRIKVVYSGGPEDEPHIRKHVRRPSASKVIQKRAKDPDDSLELVIVQSMLLRGGRDRAAGPVAPGRGVHRADAGAA